MTHWFHNIVVIINPIQVFSPSSFSSLGFRTPKASPTWIMPSLSTLFSRIRFMEAKYCSLSIAPAGVPPSWQWLGQSHLHCDQGEQWVPNGWGVCSSSQDLRSSSVWQRSKPERCWQVWSECCWGIGCWTENLRSSGDQQIWCGCCWGLPHCSYNWAPSRGSGSSSQLEALCTEPH